MAQNLVTLFTVLATLFAVLVCCGCTMPKEAVEALTNHEKNIWMETVLDRLIFTDAMKHRAVMPMDEKGTEAAAGNVFAGMMTSMEAFSYMADRTFAFLIYHQSSDAIIFSGVVNNPSRRCEEEGYLPEAGGNKMAKHQVMVEIRLPRGLSRSEAFTMAGKEIVLEGFQLDAEYGAVPMEPAEDQVSELEAAGDQIFIVRGILDKGLKETLSSIEIVINVFDEGRIEHFDRR